jgi:serine/threonine protein kinase
MQKQKHRSSLPYKLPNRIAIQWASSTAEALNYLHNLECPIIHRDLKPLNLLLTKSLDLKLADLGISKVLPPQSNDKEPAPRMSGGVGTWRYMAPEVVRYEQYTDRADIYSLGLIMFFLFAGKQPFHDFCKGDTELILKAYLKGQEVRPALEATIGSPESRELMQDCWRVVASERPSSQDCAERLSTILAAQERLRPKLNPVQVLKATWSRAVSS